MTTLPISPTRFPRRTGPGARRAPSWPAGLGACAPRRHQRGAEQAGPPQRHRVRRQGRDHHLGPLRRPVQGVRRGDRGLQREVPRHHGQPPGRRHRRQAAEHADHRHRRARRRASRRRQDRPGHAEHLCDLDRPDRALPRRHRPVQAVGVNTVDGKIYGVPWDLRPRPAVLPRGHRSRRPASTRRDRPPTTTCSSRGQDGQGRSARRPGRSTWSRARSSASCSSRCTPTSRAPAWPTPTASCVWTPPSTSRS